MINQEDILQKTHFGLYIFSQVLCYHYPDTVFVLELVGKDCKITKNPFNQNKVTLQISKLDGVFCYQDTELDDFKGNAFDFATLHYQLSGDELLQRINLDWNLHIGEQKGFYTSNLSKALPEPVAAVPRFSYFRCPISNTTPNAVINLLHAYKVIKGNRYKERTLELREIKDEKAASEFKRTHFDYVTFSGEFSKRRDKDLVHPSGLMVFDFDKVNDLPLLRKILLDDPLFVTEMLFKSPSGMGLKWIISVDLKQCSHEDWFNAVASYLDTTLQVKVDRSGKDISRACFLCHDPEVYICPQYLD